MNQPEKGTKIYISIVNRLRTMIEKDGLKAGDKIPSERELCERLNVGRSSVREALRALELLGLIETRRGEGTFIRDFEGHQFVQLLATFILQDGKAKRDIIETKYLIEMDCLWLVLYKATDEQILSLNEWTKSSHFTDDEFFLQVVQFADNHLFMRIWTILKDYYNALKLDKEEPPKQDYVQLTNALLLRQEAVLRQAYQDLRKLSKGL
ncbi:FadR family transcriptional regulator [Bacillus sp. Bva_UNVM-123]